MRQITDLENRIRKLQRDHRDCVEGNQILRAARGSSVRLSAPDFIALLKELDRFGNATVPCVEKKKKKEEVCTATVDLDGREARAGACGSVRLWHCALSIRGTGTEAACAESRQKTTFHCWANNMHTNTHTRDLHTCTVLRNRRQLRPIYSPITLIVPLALAPALALLPASDIVAVCSMCAPYRTQIGQAGRDLRGSAVSGQRGPAQDERGA